MSNEPAKGLRVKQLHVNGFGVHNNANFAIDHDAPVTVFYGHNESGKSTLLGFVRSVLFGIPTKRNQAERYEPVEGGVHGGFLTLVDEQGETYRVQRYTGKNQWSVTKEDGSVLDEQQWRELLTGVSPELFRNVFAFGLGELAELRTIQAGEMSSWLFGAGVGLGASSGSLYRIEKKLQDEMDKLFRTKGTKQELHTRLAAMEELDVELKQSRWRVEQYNDLNDRLQKVIQQLSSAEDELQDTRFQMERIERFMSVREHWERLEVIDQDIDSFPEYVQLPDDAELVYKRLNEEMMELERQLSHLSPYSCDTNIIVDFKHRFLERKQCQEQIWNSLQQFTEREKEAAVAQDKHDILPDMTMKRASYKKPEQSGLIRWVPILLLVLSLMSLGMNWLDQRVSMVAVIVLGLVNVYVWYGSFIRTKKYQALEKERILTERRLAEERELQLDTIRKEWTLLNAKSQEEQSLELQLKQEWQAWLQANGLAGNMTPDEVMSGCQQYERASHALARAREKLQSLWRLCDASSAQQFLSRACGYAERQQLLRERQQLQELLRVSVGAYWQDELRSVLQESGGNAVAADSLRRSMAEWTERVGALREEAGSLRGELARLSDGVEHADLLQRAAVEQAALLQAAEKWSALAMAKRLLQDTRSIYERERQPKVLQRASLHFAAMTGGRFHRVIAPPGEKRILVERTHGERLDTEYLSRGTAEQLYLSIRFALAEEYGQTLALPLIMDDIFVNFDYERLGNTMGVLQEVAKSHQIVLFTCHDHVRDAVTGAFANAQVISLS